MRISKIYDGSDPGGTPGKDFTSSIDQEEIIPQGAFLDHLRLGVKGAVSTAAVAIETFAGVLSEYSLKVGPETRLQMNLRQLCALMLFFYHDLPFIWENTDGTGNDFIGGVRIPVQVPAEAGKPITHTATRTAQSNIGTETIALDGVWLDSPGSKKPIHAVKIDYTLAGATGYDTPSFRIAPVGKLIGLIIQQANPFADGNVDVSVQRVRILTDGKYHTQFNVLANAIKWMGRSVGVLDPMDDLLNPFTLLDLRPEGLDAKAHELTLQLDVEDVSDAISIIPVMEME